jgi:hypothetical protein
LEIVLVYFADFIGVWEHWRTRQIPVNYVHQVAAPIANGCDQLTVDTKGDQGLTAVQQVAGVEVPPRRAADWKQKITFCITL